MRNKFLKSKIIIGACLSLTCFNGFSVSALKLEGVPDQGCCDNSLRKGVIDASYSRFLISKEGEGRQAKIKASAEKLYSRLSEIVSKVKADGIVDELPEGLLPEQYDEFCKKYICPEFFAHPKEVLSKSEYESLDNHHIDLYRGINAPDMPTLKKWFLDFQIGDFFIGAEKCGAYSTGSIEIPRESFAKACCESEGSCNSYSIFGGNCGCVMRFCYNENEVTIICQKDLQDIVNSFFEVYGKELNSKTGVEKSVFNLLKNYFIITDTEDHYHGPVAIAFLAQQGLAARILGYDLILYNEAPHLLKTGILNRSKIKVQKEPVEIYNNGKQVSDFNQ